MKYGLSWWLGSSAVVCALRVVVVLLRSGRLRVKGSNDFSSFMCHLDESVLVGG